MQATDTTQSLAPELAAERWRFLEVWIDPLQSPPYVLLLIGEEDGVCSILDPKESYRLVERCKNYDDAQLWLLEDEYEPVEGRLPMDEV